MLEEWVFALPSFPAFCQVTTATTPGAAFALLTSIARIVPFGIALPRMYPYAWFATTSCRSYA